jgi:hypothetical protein
LVSLHCELLIRHVFTPTLKIEAPNDSSLLE